MLQASCGVIFSKRIKENLFIVAKTFACLSILVEEYF